MSDAVRLMLNPGSVVVVGASPDTNKLNGRPLQFLRRDGFPGALYPLNPKYQEVLGLTCYADVAELPVAPDLAIVVVSSHHAADAVAALGRRGVAVAVVFSSGYGEMGEEGKRLERALADAARANGIRVCGPNNLGLINAFDHVTATFSQYADQPPRSGPVAFVSQSGAFGTGIAALARSRHMGLGYFVNTGNEADIKLTEVLEVIAEDARISVLCAYIEGLADGAGLLRVAHQAMVAAKPLVVTKVGRSAAGARAAVSHTGSLAGDDRVFDGALRQHGVIRARNEEHMLDLASAFTCCRVPSGRGVAMVTQSGGAGVLMADRAEELELEVPVLADATRKRLKPVMPAFGASANPIDITGQFLAEPRMLHDTVRIVLEDPAVHLCFVWLQLMHGYADVLVDVFCDLMDQVSKPFLVCWLQAPDTAVARMSDAGICVVPATERAVDAAAGLVAYGEARRRLAGRPLRLAKRSGESGPARALPRAVAATMLRDAGLPVEASNTAVSPEAASGAASATEFVLGVRRDPVFGPVVMAGLGGVFGEILDDMSFATAPVSQEDAGSMLDRLQSHGILDGVRGRPAVDREALLRAIRDLSDLAAERPEIVELDLSPVFAAPRGVVIADWRVTVDGSTDG
jgi:acetyltransferase